ncbi:MAG: hypothetical protein VXV97_17315, partial [Pseudomonadota bacterium]|nr:hypothetical protein [Pseudomonadota bacterium]
MQLKTKELRAELASRSIGWADLIEKHELASRLADAMAQAALFSPSGALSPGQASTLTAAQLRAELDAERNERMESEAAALEREESLQARIDELEAKERRRLELEEALALGRAVLDECCPGVTYDEWAIGGAGLTPAERPAAAGGAGWAVPCVKLEHVHAARRRGEAQLTFGGDVHDVGALLGDELRR